MQSGKMPKTQRMSTSFNKRYQGVTGFEKKTLDYKDSEVLFVTENGEVPAL